MLRLRSLVALLLLASSARADDAPTRLPFQEADLKPLLRTDWYGVYLQGQKAGWGMIATSRTDDPKGPAYVHVTAFVAKLKSDGAETAMNFRERIEFDAQPPYAFRSGSSRESDGRTAREITVTRRDKGFDVVVSAGGEKQTRRIDAPDYTLADLVTPGLWIRGGPKPDAKLVTRTFDFDTLKLQTEVRKLLATKSAVVEGVKVEFHEVEATVVEEKMTVHERHDRSGERVLSMKIGDLMEFRLEPEKVAKDASVAVDLFELGKVKVDRRLGDPERLDGLVLETVGKLEMNLPSGPRQQVTKDPTGTYTLKTGRAFAAPFKATADEVERALAETATLPHSNPKIRELAAKAVGDARTPREKVKKLLQFVHDFIDPSYTAQPLTVLDLLKDRKGDCSEYALLFTTLARAQGIPARELGGLLYLGDREKAFGFHAWCEVVLDGEWIPVDPSANQMEVDPSHVSFGSHGGEQATNMAAAFGKLSLKVVEVRERK